jgi:hypothetical protein
VMIGVLLALLINIPASDTVASETGFTLRAQPPRRFTLRWGIGRFSQKLKISKFSEFEIL